jgi:5-methylcytosine-specific restriction protein A
MSETPARSSAPLVDALTTVRSSYVGQTRERDASGVVRQKWRRRNESAPSSVLALERDFHAWLQELTSFRAVQYVVKSSAGQPGRRFTLIPYAMLLRRDVTSSPTHGVYIALLFDESCQKLWVTLNQGISQFRDHFGIRRSFAALRQAAGLLAGLLPAPVGFSSDGAMLNASNPYGQAYEVGAIYSREFDLNTFGSETATTFVAALVELLCFYEAMPLAMARDPSLAGNLRDAGDDEKHFQDLVNNKAAAKGGVVLPDAPKAPPKRKGLPASTAYQRDPTVAASALRAAQHRCEASCRTEPFVANATGLPYVEAHHLVPLSKQDCFLAISLDVPANVVALCATCHAKIHLAIKAVREPLIATLHAKRAERLRTCGIECDLPQLKKMYQRNL